jgi:acyl carrier protein
MNESLIQFLKEEFDFSHDGEWNDVNILDDILIDSLNMLRLVEFMERSFNITFKIDDLSIDNFLSLSSIEALISRKLAN